MKKIRWTYGAVICSLFLLVFQTSCINGKWVKGNGNVITQERKVDAFTAISASSGLDVYLVQGDEEAVTVEADENLMDIIVTEVRGNKLFVKTRENIRRARSRIVYVTFTKLEQLDVAAGSDVISREKLNLDHLDIEVSSGADLKLKMNAKEVSCSVSSGADAVLSGEVDTFYGRASSGSDLRARDLKAKYCDAKASSGGDVSVYAIEHLKASANSGGDVSYYGDPKKKDVRSSSGGDVNHR